MLSSLVASIFTPAAFEEGHSLSLALPPTTPKQGVSEEGEDSDELKLLQVPQGTAKKEFVDWVNRLPEREPPTYLGLEANAEKLLLVAHADEMGRNLKRVLEVLDEGESVMAEAEAEAEAEAGTVEGAEEGREGVVA